MSADVSVAPLRRPSIRVRLWTLLWLLVAIGYAVLLGTHIDASLADAADPAATLLAQEAIVTTFLRVVVVAAAFWLVLLRRRSGNVLAVVYGVVTLLILALSVGTVNTTVQTTAPPVAPAWLQLAGVLSAAAVALGGGLALRAR